MATPVSLHVIKTAPVMVVLVASLIGCGGGGSSGSNTGTNTAIAIGDISTIEINGVVLSSLPETTAQPADERVDLGRLLFWDPILSGDQDVACATCHLPEFGYADGRARSVGVGGVGTGPARVVGRTGVVPRNAPTVLNTAFNGISELGSFNPQLAPMFWDNRTQSLENQALEPIRSQQEMRGDNFTASEIDAVIVNRLQANSSYLAQFQAAFGTSVITTSLVAQALADFQRTLVANNSAFDRWVRGDTSAMTATQIQGMNEFVLVGCASCHSGPMFSDFETHILGVPEADGLITPDSGDGNFAFRTPTLRQLQFTAPYFHGGQNTSLLDAIEFYDRPSLSQNPNVPTSTLADEFLSTPTVNGERAERIELFLNALSDGAFDRSRPSSVPSGLPVGGLIE